MKRDELYALAQEYKIPGRSKMTGSELSAALVAEGCDLDTAAHEKFGYPCPTGVGRPNIEVAQNALSTVLRSIDGAILDDSIIDRVSEPAEVERPTDDQRNVTFGARMGTGPEITDDSVGQAQLRTLAGLTPFEAQRLMMDFNATHKGIQNLINAIGPRYIVRARRAAKSRNYGDNGRGTGAKHLPHDGKLNRGMRTWFSPNAIKPLSYGDRVRHYGKQNGQLVTRAESFKYPAVLTDRQWRRAEHKNRAHRNTFNPEKAARY